MKRQVDWLFRDWTRSLGWPGYQVYWHELDEKHKTLKLWVRRKCGAKKLVCSGVRATYFWRE